MEQQNITCDRCKTKFQIKTKTLYNTVQCKECGNTFKLPKEYVYNWCNVDHISQSSKAPYIVWFFFCIFFIVAEIAKPYLIKKIPILEKIFITPKTSKILKDV